MAFYSLEDPMLKVKGNKIRMEAGNFVSRSNANEALYARTTRIKRILNGSVVVFTFEASNMCSGSER